MAAMESNTLVGSLMTECATAAMMGSNVASQKEDNDQDPVSDRLNLHRGRVSSCRVFAVYVYCLHFRFRNDLCSIQARSGGVAFSATAFSNEICHSTQASEGCPLRQWTEMRP